MSIIQSGTESADLAVRLSPQDPETHYTRGLSLVNAQRLADAVGELKQAIEMRPHHYYQWLDLGVTLDRVGDVEGGLAALRESVRLAPFYAQPRWQLGNLLFRQGLYEEGFQNLRLATKSDLSLSEGMLELAWAAADGDVGRFEAMVQPESTHEHFRSAEFLARQGEATEAVKQAGMAGEPRDDLDTDTVRRTITQLLSTQKVPEAYAVWATSHGERADDSTGSTSPMLNSNFMSAIRQNDVGFSWQLVKVPNVSMSIDSIGPEAGSRSLRIEYQGDSPTQSTPLYQVILIHRRGRYSLSFMAKTHELVTGGPPVIRVVGGTLLNDGKILGQSDPITQGAEWTPYTFEFSVDEGTSAVTIVVQRQACNQSPCPIFGALWLSAFTLKNK
jgi:hypothetical protein